MPFYTPRGLKVRVDPFHAFALMGRLEPETQPIQVLRTTEALEFLPAVGSLLGAVAMFFVNSAPLPVGLGTFAGGIVGGAISRYGLFMIPGAVSLGHIYARISGFGVLTIVLAGALWIGGGWPVALAYLLGRIAAGLTNGLLNIQRSRAYVHVLGHPLTASEVNFFNAYRLCASAIGRSTDLDVSDEERKKTAPGTLERFAAEWPDIAARIQVS